MRSPCMLVHNLSWVGPRRATPLSLHACFSRSVCLQNRRFGRYMGYTDNTILALRAARGVVGVLPVPIPALSAALDAALEIAKLLKSVKDTRKACKELAERATAYTLDVYEELNSCGTAVDGTAAQAGVTKLLSVLEKIQAMMARKERKGFMKFTLHLAKNKSEVEDLSRELTDVQNIFLVRTGIRTDARLVAMGDQQREIVQHMQDRERVDDTLLCAAHKHGTMLVEVREQLGKIDLANDRFRLCMTEVKLLEDVDEDWEMGEDVGQETTTAGCSIRGGTEGIVRYRAEMYADKSPLIVKRFPRRGRTFTDEVELVKQLWHPNIVQLRGYSHDPEIAFIAYNMEQHVGSFEALGHEMSGVERLLWVLHATKQVHSALQHLASQSALFQWTEDHSDCAPLTGGSDLVVRPNASVVLDVSRWEVNQHQLPNLVVLYDWVILLNSAERRLIQARPIHRSEEGSARARPRPQEATRADHAMAAGRHYRRLRARGLRAVAGGPTHGCQLEK
ncbi:hypothetical protein C2E23DRAFT_413865 [Lenzites betulinus]|nr:hypothetical protein C2E23DRAFT_413865 [Lenzites betulinus]